MTNTTFNLRLNKKLKDDFLAKAKERWFDWSNLMRLFMETFISSPEILKVALNEEMIIDIIKWIPAEKQITKMAINWKQPDFD